MLPDLKDTIVAQASAAGVGARGIVRLSGPASFAIVARLTADADLAPNGAEVSSLGHEPQAGCEQLGQAPKERQTSAAVDHFRPSGASGTCATPFLGLTPQATDFRPSGARGKASYSANLHLSTAYHSAPVPADILLWPNPRSYTGQEMAELHTFASPPLLEAVVAECLRAGARAAQPGEFTMRAFLAGKLDLPRAEAVLAVIDSSSAGELKRALAQLAGGVSQPMQNLRDDLLNLLADLEAALDFADEDIEFVSSDSTLLRIGAALAHLTLVRKQLEERALPERPFRVVLAGKPNAGKSSLFNALAGRSAALVSDTAGTTRDYLLNRLQIEGSTIEVIDTAGVETRDEGRGARDEPLARGQELGEEQAADADLVLWCREAGDVSEMRRSNAREVKVATKCDLAAAGPNELATSARTGAGIADLRAFLAARAREHSRPALAPSLSRCRGHVDACLGHLRRVHMMVLSADPPELIACEIRGALDQLGEMVGAVYTDDLLDRIFSRFCIGK